MLQGHLDYFQNPPLGGRPNTKPDDHGTPNAHNHWYILFYHVWRPAWIEIHSNGIWLRSLVTYGFTLHSRVRDHTTWSFGGVLDNLLRLSFRLSQFHGHGSWLVCEVALYESISTGLSNTEGPTVQVAQFGQERVACGGPPPHPKFVALNGYAREP